MMRFFYLLVSLFSCALSMDGICYAYVGCDAATGCGLSLGENTANGHCVNFNFTVRFDDGSTRFFPSLQITERETNQFQAIFWAGSDCGAPGAPYSPRCPALTCCPFDANVNIFIGANRFEYFYVGSNNTGTTAPLGPPIGLILGLSLGLALPLLIILIVVITCLFGRRKKKRAQYNTL